MDTTGKWQQQGFASYRAWRLADEKARKARKKTEQAASAASATGAVETAALAAVADVAMAQAANEDYEVDEDGWPVYNNPVATAAATGMEIENGMAPGSSRLDVGHDEPMVCDCEELTGHAVDESMLAVLNPSTQADGQAMSPAQRWTLLQPVSSELTPGGFNVRHQLEDATPRGTHVASTEYVTAAATP